MDPNERPIMKHEFVGFAGYTCCLCGKNIGKLPMYILSLFLEHPNGYRDFGNHQHAHPSCAKRAGLKEIGDEIDA